jgi:hypothetical protein
MLSGKRGHVKRGRLVTDKEKAFVKEFVRLTAKGEKTYKAAQKAGALAYKDTLSVKKVYIYRVLARDRVQKYICQLLDKAGFTDQAIMRDLRRLVTRGLESPKTSLSDAARGLDMVLKLKNRYPAQKIQSESVKYNADLMRKSNRSLRKELSDLEAEEAEFDDIEEGEVIEE